MTLQVKPVTLCDASALIALINQSDANHQRCVDILPQLLAPLLTTWSCFTEAMYLLGRYGGWSAQQELWGYVADQILLLHQNNVEEQERMRSLMEQYRDIPMDLADASLVATAETLNQRRIFTLDRDFHIYRFRGNQSFEVVP
ncbi:type II toxin-antitoxin system VapC family toxin [Nostoc sp.]|uniref:type II toxin-antitoxin system VapC family toxin n=1 Tax=Nostoc sp. TaxID=1180 RepID=UPI003593EFF4